MLYSPVYSRVTLAMMEDSGWYIPDYSKGKFSLFSLFAIKSETYVSFVFNMPTLSHVLINS